MSLSFLSRDRHERITDTSKWSIYCSIEVLMIYSFELERWVYLTGNFDSCQFYAKVLIHRAFKQFRDGKITGISGYLMVTLDLKLMVPFEVISRSPGLFLCIVNIFYIQNEKLLTQQVIYLVS